MSEEISEEAVRVGDVIAFLRTKGSWGGKGRKWTTGRVIEVTPKMYVCRPEGGASTGMFTRYHVRKDERLKVMKRASGLEAGPARSTTEDDMSKDTNQMNEIVKLAAEVVMAIDAGDTASTEVHELQEAIEAFDPELLAYEDDE